MPRSAQLSFLAAPRLLSAPCSNTRDPWSRPRTRQHYRFSSANGCPLRDCWSFLELLVDQEAIYSSGNDPYLNTHPITRSRVEFVRNHLRNSKFAHESLPRQFDVMHRRMRGKLNGFIDPPERTLKSYGPEDRGAEALYARAVAHMRQNNVDQAIENANLLLEQSPNDPFYLELKGDILRNAGRIRESIAPYQAAISIVPWAALIRVNLAQAQLAFKRRRFDPRRA